MSNEKALANVRRKKGPFYAWKALRVDGSGMWYSGYTYRPGWNKPTEDRGLHVYRKRVRGIGPLLRVRVWPQRVIGAEPSRWRDSELEVDHLFIFKADWEAWRKAL